MSEHIITIKQLATVIKKCKDWPLSDKDGNPIVNPLEIDRDEVVELPEIVRCRNCASFREEDWKCKSFQWRNCYESPDVEPDGFCAWAERRTNDNQ